LIFTFFSYHSAWNISSSSGLAQSGLTLSGGPIRQCPQPHIPQGCPARIPQDRRSPLNPYLRAHVNLPLHLNPPCKIFLRNRNVAVICFRHNVYLRYPFSLRWPQFQEAKMKRLKFQLFVALLVGFAAVACTGHGCVSLWKRRLIQSLQRVQDCCGAGKC
jgi:hypothetical protein